MIGALLVLLDQIVGPSVPRLIRPIYEETVGAAARWEQERWARLVWPEVDDDAEVVDEVTLPVLPLDPGAPVIPLRRSE